MIKVLVKNHLKVLWRNKMALWMSILYPVFVMLISSIGLSGMMKEEVRLGEIVIGISEDIHNQETEGLLSYLGKQNIETIVLEENVGIWQVGERRIIAYLTKTNGHYTLYLSDKMTDQSDYVKNQIRIYEQGPSSQLDGLQEKALVTYEKIEAPKPISSETYYCMVGWTSFLWLGAWCAGKLASLEVKEGINERLNQIHIPAPIVLLGRLLPIVLIQLLTWIGMIGVIRFGLEVDFGTFTFKVLAIILLELIAFVCFTTCLSFWIYNELGLLIIVECIWFVFSFLGGNHQPYMFNFIDRKWQMMSPFYNLNHCLVDVFQYGKSAYLKSTLFFLLGLMAISIFLGIVGIKIRRGRDANYKNTH